VMEDGRVVAEGGPADLFAARPQYAPVLWQATAGVPGPRPALCPSELRLIGGGPR